MLSSRREFIAESALAALGTATMGLASANASAQVSTTNSGVPATNGSRRRVDSIDWYYELSGRGQPVVLIPSGEGDCGSFERVAKSLSGEFRVLTFDMPGFSRSSDPSGFSNYSMAQAAREVAGLVRALQLAPATFYGCSSGGQVALGLAADHPEIVRNVIVHEVALPSSGSVRGTPRQTLASLMSLSDDEIVRACKALFRDQLNEDGRAWDALGDAFHRRLERNYVTWVRRYFGPAVLRTFTEAELHQCPVTWTIGGLTPAASFFNNVEMAHRAGIQIGLLMCRHFPQVSIPDELAAHISESARKAAA